MAASSDPLAGVTGFEWNEHNSGKIRHRRAVEPSECEEVLLLLPRIVRDATHSVQEARFIAFGPTATGRRLAVVFTLRGTRLRVVTARDQSRRERKELGDA